MNDDDKMFTAGMSLASVVWFLIAGLWVGWCESSWRKEAISNGVAFYSVNPTTGAAKFEWRNMSLAATNGCSIRIETINGGGGATHENNFYNFGTSAPRRVKQ